MKQIWKIMILSPPKNVQKYDSLLLMKQRNWTHTQIFRHFSRSIIQRFMATSKAQLEFFLECLEGIPDLRAKAMF